MCQECILLPLHPRESLRLELSPGCFLQAPCILSVCCGFGDKDVGSWRILRCEQEHMASSSYVEWGHHSPGAQECAWDTCQYAASEPWASPLPPSSSSSWRASVPCRGCGYRTSPASHAVCSPSEWSWASLLTPAAVHVSHQRTRLASIPRSFHC